jgi:N-acetylornithine carbamoyltransferase
MKHLIDGDEFGIDFVKEVINNAISFKKNKKSIPNHYGKVISLMFFNKSLRTRFSFISGIFRMGATPICENLDGIYSLEKNIGAVMNQDNPEHIKDMMAVISRYSDIICIRDSLLSKGGVIDKFNKEDIVSDKNIREMASYSEKIIINMESDSAHPMQGMADAMTMMEKATSIKKKKICLTWTPHIKKLPIATPQSQLLMPAMLGADITLACPKGCELSDVYMEKIKNYANSFTICNNQEDGIEDADFVIGKSWSSLTDDNFSPYSSENQKWMLDQNKMNLAKKDLGYFSHCMPIRRNVEVSDDVIDGKKSIMLDVAENRMWLQMAVIDKLLKI